MARFPSARLGRSTLEVVPVGLASAYGISGSEVERAFERGIDFFYWGSARTPWFGGALRRLGAQHRARMKVVVQTYARWPSQVERSLEGALKDLHFDYADILLLGWWNLPPRDSILDVAADLVRRGRARAVMVSCHHRPTFARLARDPRVDHLMVRYNAAHPGAEQDVFPGLSRDRPGIIAYTATSWGQLVTPSTTPAGDKTPSAADCYRFVLSNPSVDACWSGPKTASELDAALAALEAGPMSDEELAWMRRVGAEVRKREALIQRGASIGDRVVNVVSGFGFKSTSQLPKE